jgi:hypothetical protein
MITLYGHFAIACYPVQLGLARTIYIRLINGIFGREITKYTVIYGVYIRFWPTLCTTLSTRVYNDASRLCRVGQNHIYMVYIQYFWQGITKYTVVHGVYIRFWPTLRLCPSLAFSIGQMHQCMSSMHDNTHAVTLTRTSKSSLHHLKLCITNGQPHPPGSQLL